VTVVADPRAVKSEGIQVIEMILPVGMNQHLLLSRPPISSARMIDGVDGVDVPKLGAYRREKMRAGVNNSWHEK